MEKRSRNKMDRVAQKARLTKRFQRSQQERKKRTPWKPRVSKAAFLKAMVGTGGIRAQIAKNLDVPRATVTFLLEKEDWDDIRQMWLDEIEAGIDEAEECIRFAIRQRLDLGTASLNARWFLSKVRQERFGDKKTVTHEGGQTPIHISQNIVSVESLNLPPDVLRRIVEAADEVEEKNKVKRLKAEISPVEVEDEGTEC